MIKVGDTVTPIDGPSFVHGKVEDIGIVNGITFAYVVWNKPGRNRRIHISKIKTVN